MNKKIEIFHATILLSLLILIPITERIDHDIHSIVGYLFLGYGVVVTIFIFVKFVFMDSIKERGFKNTLFTLWLYLSIIIGLVGGYAVIMYGIDDAPWAILPVIYGLVVGYINRRELNKRYR